ncbi:MAG: CoA transferase [Pseudomonadales bacterium]|jgi:alpha-methylacyl-CoA racemase|nr:carnitine dehydratase [Gammaproteobacteria bacterium]MCH1596897.1 CoA transferase [Pseudomonadales bacterium]RPG34095.1 MAG: CoA transferase [Gammaproteobacteria bacterium TMED243]|tara:strand:+ start:504 stop:1640 length:1137 start_codon:yes stop_codon:yes gene_type:complete
MGPLNGFKIIELAGIGPGPFCGMMLADMGAEVIRVERIAAAQATEAPKDVLTRNRRSIAVDLKNPKGVETVLRLVEGADGLIEGFRPGVTERLGLGPEQCQARNPRLVYGRMTGWGQEGPMAQAAGHDINYISLAGALHAIGRPGERPVPPLNLVGDFGGGGMLLAYGMVCGLLEVTKSNEGQVIDAAMVDGTAALMAMFYSMSASGAFDTQRGTNLLDGGAHFYDTYETADGEHVSIGSIEPQFYALLMEKAGLDAEYFQPQMNKGRWGELKAKLTEVFLTKTQAEWCDIMEGSDVCFAPVLNLIDAATHPHNVARNSYQEVAGVLQQAPAPRFSRTPAAAIQAPRVPGEDSASVLADFGLTATEVAQLTEQGVVSG